MSTAASSAAATTPSRSGQILLVAGSGRSGTSLFTGLTGELGLYIPKPEVKANRSNPRGFGEPRWAVDFHNELLSSLDVVVDDGRPEAWMLTDALAQDDAVAARLTSWLAEQLDQSSRIVVKDPRLGWFLALYGRACTSLGADLHVATLLRHPAEVLRSRELAYGTKTTNTTRVIGWVNMMLGTEARTRELPRATVRYDDLLSDWQPTMRRADATLGLGLLDDPERVAAAGDLVDPSLHRSLTDWADLDLPPHALDLATRVYAAYGQLEGRAAHEQDDVRAELDGLGAEFAAWYDECFDVSRSRTGARVRKERRQAGRRARKLAPAGGERTARGYLGRARDLVRRRVASS
jgi:hypothetical protein